MMDEIITNTKKSISFYLNAHLMTLKGGKKFKCFLFVFVVVCVRFQTVSWSSCVKGSSSI